MQSYEQVKAQWKRHACTSESGVCDCLFEFPCQSCGVTLKVQGENLDFVIGIGGLCEMCYYGLRAEDIAIPTPPQYKVVGNEVGERCGSIYRFYCTLAAWPYSPAARSGITL